MGSAESRLSSNLLEAILCGRDGTVARMLKEQPKLVNCTFHSGTTNPICRATFLGHRNIVSLLLKYGADINMRSSDERTPLMWAAFRDNVEMIEMLLLNNPDLTAVDKDGFNALDIAIIRINFKAARRLSKAGMSRRPMEEYEGKTWRKYDI
jgi:ankyrin repeat protein